jgi:hypothetical protein
MKKVLSRDEGWVTFYRDNIDALDVSDRRLRENEEEQKVLEKAGIRDGTTGDVSKVNDRIAKLRIQVSDAFSKTASHKQCEEAVRIIGSTLGFHSTRPCTDVGKGPDNLWTDTHTNSAIAFELKSDKGAEGMLGKDDIGQGLNHIEWVRTQLPDIKLLGLVFVTDAEKLSEKSSPSDKMHLGSQDHLRRIWDDFIGLIERNRMKSPLEKLAEASKIGELAEWQLDGILRRLSKKKLSK